jgi:hypothetical protein
MKRFIHSTEKEGTELLEILKENDNEYHLVADAFDGRPAIRIVLTKEGFSDLIQDLQKIIE